MDEILSIWRACKRFANTHWTPSSDGSTLSGTVAIRVGDIPVSVTIPLLGTSTCDLAIGGSSFVDTPVQIVLPQGTSAAGFIPGCTPVSGVQVTVSSLPVSLTSPSTLCQVAKDEAQNAGALRSVTERLASLIVDAVENQICMTP